MENTSNHAPSRWKFAAKLAGAHLGISLLIALLMAGVVFKLWYPYPYNQMAGGLELYWMVVVIDVICGPLLMAILASPNKSRRAMWVDFSLIFTIQLSALLYGLHAVSLARPVAVMFEYDRFVMVSAAEIPPQEADAPLSWLGAQRVVLQEPRTVEEKNHDIDLLMKGIEAHSLPSRWQADSAAGRQAAVAAMHPLSMLEAHYPQQKAEIGNIVQRSGQPANRLGFLPLTNDKSKDWIVVLDQQAEFIGFLPLDGFSARESGKKTNHN